MSEIILQGLTREELFGEMQRMIRQAVAERYGGELNKRQAARELEISVSTLDKRIARHEIATIPTKGQKKIPMSEILKYKK